MIRFLSILAIIVILVFGGFLIFSITPYGKGVTNTYDYNVQKVDDATNYKILKEVEDTCRAMISSYESDKLIYEQYKKSDSEEKQSWGEQAKIRANKTAIIYNNYILKNNYIWEDNIPEDIKAELDIVE